MDKNKKTFNLYSPDEADRPLPNGLFGKVKQFLYGKWGSCITKQINTIMQIFYTPGFIRRAFLLCSLLLVVKLTSTMAQDSLRVEGIILSKPNNPVSEVSISAEGSENLPVVTDSTGKFTLEVPVGNNWIMVSPASKFKKQTIFLNSRSNITVYLTPLDEASGQDMVTVLSQNIQKRNMVAAFTSLNTAVVVMYPLFVWLFNICRDVFRE